MTDCLKECIPYCTCKETGSPMPYDKAESPSDPGGYTPDFARGVVYALARLVELYDQPTMADSVLREASISNDDLRSCAEYDLAFLRKENPDIPRGV